MASLRDAFIKKAETDAEKQRHRQEKVFDRFFEKEIGRLREKITKNTHKGHTEVVLYLPDQYCRREEAQASNGYYRLHEICASDDVDVKLEIKKATKWPFLGAIGGPFVFIDREHMAIVITLDKPYNDSPDAGIHLSAAAAAPKTLSPPAAIGLKKDTPVPKPLKLI